MTVGRSHHSLDGFEYVKKYSISFTFVKTNRKTSRKTNVNIYMKYQRMVFFTAERIY